MMEKPLRSQKKRLIKKHFKKTGVLPAICVGKVDGLWWYKCKLPDMSLYFADYLNKIQGVSDAGR